MKKAIEMISRLSTGCAYVGIAAIFGMLLIILGEIFVRTFFNTSLLFTIQVSNWLLLVLISMGAAWTLKVGGHVRIGIISSHLSQRNQHKLIIGFCTLGVLVFILFSYYAWQGLMLNYTYKMTGETIYRLPLWWAWVPLVVGSVVLAIQFVGIILENIISLKTLGQEREKGSSLKWLAALGIMFVGMMAFLNISHLTSTTNAAVLLLIVITVLACLIGSSLWIFLSMSITGVLALYFFTNCPLGELAATVTFHTGTRFVLVCLPLFIFMGELLIHSGASRYFYTGIAPWVERIPGRLLHSNILSCTFFAAVSGSSAVTCAAVSSIAVPELKRLGYDEGSTLGTLAGAGTLGLLIPPSLTMIVYGAMTGESIGQLFAGGILPGLVISAMFMFYIGLKATRNPSITPPTQTYSWKDRAIGITKTIPILIVIAMVLGLIYAGITTPTEAGAIGAFCGLVLALVYRKLNWQNIKAACFTTIRTNSMTMLILCSACILGTTIAYLYIPERLMEAVAAAGLSKYSVMAIISVIYIALGCLFTSTPMLVLTLPIVYPLMTGLGFDGIWLGVTLTVLIETAQITPPIGVNLFILQNISGRSMSMIVKNSIPYFFILCIGVLILVLFPNLALVLPRLMIR